MAPSPRSCALLAVLPLLGAACSASREPGSVALGVEDAGAAAAVSTDALLTLRLPARVSTGYAWGVEAIDPAVLQLVDRSQESDGSLGGTDVEVLRFAGVAAGHTRLALRQRRPWAAPDPADPVYAVEVDVAGPYAGPAVARPAALRAVQPELRGAALLGSAPAHYDLCDPGDGSHAACTPVKDQGGCGGCWAFATAGVTENLLYRLDTSRVPDLSEQYLISCNTDGWSCKGGGYLAFDYYISRKMSPPETAAGAVYEADFPFTGGDGTCGSVAHPHHEKLSSWAHVGVGSGLAQQVAAIKQAMLDHGPIWVSVCADDAFTAWRGGTPFAGDGCTTPNHAVVLTGWDDASGAWILRNSWGKYWGESGYMRIAYGANVVGGDAAYAVLASTPPNTAPVASAGPAQEVGAGAAVTLDGSASHDAEGALASYAWTQLSGPSVTLGSAAAARATFTAPTLDVDATLTFQLRVVDAAGAAATATTTVTVKASATSGGGDSGSARAPVATGVEAGCQTGGGAGGWVAVLWLGLWLASRRSRLTPAPRPAKPAR